MSCIYQQLVCIAGVSFGNKRRIVTNNHFLIIVSVGLMRKNVSFMFPEVSTIQLVPLKLIAKVGVYQHQVD